LTFWKKYSIIISENKRRKRENKMFIVNEIMKAILAFYAFLLNTKVAVALLKLAYNERGYWGIGSEWLLIFGLLAITFIVGHYLFSWMDEKIGDRG
jgi:preprotein translocase subunit SecY